MSVNTRRPHLYDPASGNPRHFKPGGLLDLPQTRHWQREIERAIGNDRYGYQLATDARNGSDVTIGGRSFLQLSSYDYLNLISHPFIHAAARDALDQFGTGTGGVRLLTGTNQLHLELEASIARFIGTEAAMTLTSGYMANLTPLTALFGKNDLLIADEKIHRSLAESCRLSAAELLFFRHNEPQNLRQILEKQPHNRRKLILTEGVFSMDGDRCPLPELLNLKKEFGAFLLVDEAHSLGVNGAGGRGVHEHFSIEASEIDLWTGSLSKTIPANGGYVAGDAALILYLQHAGAPYFFSSALSPASTAAALAAFRVIEREPERILRLRHNASALRSSLHQLGFDTGLSDSAIVPLITGSADRAHDLARKLFEQGIHATAVVYPAVPVGQARLRLCASAGHSEATWSRLEDALRYSEPIPAKVTPTIHF